MTHTTPRVVEFYKGSMVAPIIIGIFTLLLLALVLFCASAVIWHYIASWKNLNPGVARYCCLISLVLGSLPLIWGLYISLLSKFDINVIRFVAIMSAVIALPGIILGLSLELMVWYVNRRRQSRVITEPSLENI